MNSTKIIFNRYLKHRHIDLTYIVGAKCKDGVVLVSDSRVTRGNDISQDTKIINPIPNVVLGASGLTGIFTKFLNQVNDHINGQQIKTWDELMNVVEDLVLQLDRRYRERTFGTIDVIMATKKSTESSELYFIANNGMAEEIKNFIAIGHGEPYGSLFMKSMWNKDMTMQQTAEIATFIITIISQYAVDSSVDSTPQIWYIPFKGDIRPLRVEEQSEIVSKAWIMHANLEVFLRTLLDSKDVNMRIQAEKREQEIQ